MAGPTERFERLLNLTAALLETTRPLTAAEIMERVPGYPDGLTAFRRTFERDKEELRELGIPLTLHEVVLDRPEPETGYTIRRQDYYLRDPGLEADELASLHLAASMVRLDGGHAAAALWKLGGVPHATKARNAIERANPAVTQLPADAALAALFDAVTRRRTASFGYRGERREVEPYRLDFVRGRWYLTGFDRLRGAERNFRLDRIEGEVEVAAKGTFELPSTELVGARKEPWELGEGEPVVAEVLVDASHAAIARNQLGDRAEVAERPDGSVVVSLPVTNVSGLRSFVLSFLEHAEVLGPPEVRADVVSWLDAVVGAAP